MLRRARRYYVTPIPPKRPANHAGACRCDACQPIVVEAPDPQLALRKIAPYIGVEPPPPTPRRRPPLPLPPAPPPPPPPPPKEPVTRAAETAARLARERMWMQSADLRRPTDEEHAELRRMFGLETKGKHHGAR